LSSLSTNDENRIGLNTSGKSISNLKLLNEYKFSLLLGLSLLPLSISEPDKIISLRSK